MSATRHAVFAAVLMLLAAGLAYALTPTHKLADRHGRLQLEQVIPQRFGDWRPDPYAGAGVVNPQQAELLSKIYTATLSRTYLNSRGERVMLAIAYGEDQRDSLQLHYPEVCYPAQGFQMLSQHTDTLRLANGQSIPVKRLETVFGRQRFEPVTYWTMIGEQPVLKGTTKKLAEMRYSLRGEIPDGLLFRVSSIDRDTTRAFALQDAFLSELVAALDAKSLPRLTGLSVMGGKG